MTGREKTHVVILKDKTEIPITLEQYKDLQNPSYKENDFVVIEDKNTLEVMFHGRYKELERFREIKKVDTSMRRWICDFWTRHTMDQEECDCESKFKVTITDFRSMMYKLYWKKEIVSEMTDKWKRDRETYYSLYPQDLIREQKLEIVRMIKSTKKV